MSRHGDQRYVSSDLIFRALHDLQAPARHMRSFLLMFRESNHDSNLTAESVELLDAASRAADELRDTIVAIRSALSIPTSTGATARVDLAMMIQGAWKKICEKYSDVVNQGQLVIEGNAQIASDERLLADLVGELLENSWRFKKPSASLLMQCRINAHTGNTTIELSDNGLGIDPERIEWSMQPFHRGHHDDGFGLGLTRCQCIAATIGGELSLRSDGSTGTTAVLTFH